MSIRGLYLKLNNQVFPLKGVYFYDDVGNLQTVKQVHVYDSQDFPVCQQVWPFLKEVPYSPSVETDAARPIGIRLMRIYVDFLPSVSSNTALALAIGIWKQFVTTKIASMTNAALAPTVAIRRIVKAIGIATLTNTALGSVRVSKRYKTVGLLTSSNIALAPGVAKAMSVNYPANVLSTGSDWAIAGYTTNTQVGAPTFNGGSGSYTYSWARISGSLNVEISSTTVQRPYFRAWARDGVDEVATFRVTVTDTVLGQVDTDDVVVTCIWGSTQ